MKLVPRKQHHAERAEGAVTEHPRDTLSQMRHDFDSLLERFFSNWPRFGDGGQIGLDFQVEDKENELIVHAEAPGFEPKDFQVDVCGDELAIKAQHKTEETSGDQRQFRRSEFYRSVTLPHGIEPDRVEAKYRNGVLEIHLPKGEQAKGKRIEVKAE